MTPPVTLRAVLAAALGLLGVLVGAVLTQVLTQAQEGRGRRLEALVAVIAASGRVIGAHERLFELFEQGTSPPLSDERAARAATERSDAHAEWRSARARVEILFAGDAELLALMDVFDESRVRATGWVRAYYRAGDTFDFRAGAEDERASWLGMRESRGRLIRAAKARAARPALQAFRRRPDELAG